MCDICVELHEVAPSIHLLLLMESTNANDVDRLDEIDCIRNRAVIAFIESIDSTVSNE